jgi:methyl-accepting chemotaxis protein
MSLETPTPDAFSMLRDLIALAVDPSATRTRLAKLQKLLEQTAAAEQRLAERSAKHDEKVARDRDELEERSQKVRQREVAIHAREARLAADQALVEKAKADWRSRHHDPNLFGTLTREPDRSDKPLTDAHFGT